MGLRLFSVLLVMSGLMAAVTPVRSQEAAAKVRIGTYDSRAVAIAYAASGFNPVAEKQRELKAAKAAGDRKKIAELEAWGPAHQRALHRQGFGRVPVDDLLAHVAGRLPEAARKAGVEAIVFECNWSSPGLEVVDVTDALVALYAPSERTLAMIADLKKHPPLDLGELEKHQDDH